MVVRKLKAAIYECVLALAKPGSWAKFGLEGWLAAAAKRLHHNVLAAALANKLARIAWSVLYHGRSFARDFELQSVS